MRSLCQEIFFREIANMKDEKMIDEFSKALKTRKKGLKYERSLAFLRRMLATFCDDVNVRKAAEEHIIGVMIEFGPGAEIEVEFTFDDTTNSCIELGLGSNLSEFRSGKEKFVRFNIADCDLLEKFHHWFFFSSIPRNDKYDTLLGLYAFRFTSEDAHSITTPLCALANLVRHDNQEYIDWVENK